ncbi:MAG: ZIP family metal transporter [Candidatus Kaiserbacteria bacterium]|nr:ZIP family metal transporter [Candidatus Kaiserbacteria bacterium]
MLFLIAAAACAATLLGGLFALRLHDRLHLVLGFSAGAVVGVAFFDLMPEAIRIGGVMYGAGTITAVIALGFALYLLADRLIVLHHHHEGVHAHKVSLGALSLAIHSFLDGVGIGLAYQVSPAIGLVLAAAVLAHDFSDGINTVSVVLHGRGEQGIARRWLIIDAIAPILGIVATLFVSVSESVLGVLLALFAGFFLYIGASDLLPESHHAHPVRWTTFSSILGMLVIYLAVSLAA